MSVRLTRAAGRAAALAAREKAGSSHATLLRHGSLAVAFYVPDPADPLAPHARDAVYVVAAGTATFVCDGAPQPVEPGEAVFVAAGVRHHIEDASGDFGLWVMFHGPVGGEGEAPDVPPHS